MCVQALWDRDPVLLQLPHVTREIAMRAKAAGIETVFDLMEMDDDERVELLAMPPAHLADVARVCNRYPSVELAFEVEDLEQFAKDAAAKGYPLSDGPTTSSTGTVFAFIDAPEGYEIELIQAPR
jgi:pre-mRNA-splicing helicase BRR2